MNAAIGMFLRLRKFNKGGKMNHIKLEELKAQDKAKIISVALEGTCHLWEVDGHPDNYVSLVDKTVITQKDDNEYGDPIFSYSEFIKIKERPQLTQITNKVNSTILEQFNAKAETLGIRKKEALEIAMRLFCKAKLG